MKHAPRPRPRPRPRPLLPLWHTRFSSLLFPFPISHLARPHSPPSQAAQCPSPSPRPPPRSPPSSPPPPAATPPLRRRGCYTPHGFWRRRHQQQQQQQFSPFRISPRPPTSGDAPLLLRQAPASAGGWFPAGWLVCTPLLIRLRPPPSALILVLFTAARTPSSLRVGSPVSSPVCLADLPRAAGGVLL